MAVGRHEDVLGLQVAVDDALPVRGRQALRNLARQVGRCPRRERPLAQRRRQRLAFEQLQDDVGDAAVHTHVEHLHHVRVVEGGRGPRFLLEALQALGARRERGRQDLDGDVALEAGVAGEINLTHATGAKGLTDFVGTEPPAGRKSQRAIIASSSGRYGYCWRNASIGSTFAARRAGRQPASAETTAISPTAAAIVSGSCGGSPYSTAFT